MAKVPDDYVWITDDELLDELVDPRDLVARQAGIWARFEAWANEAGYHAGWRVLPGSVPVGSGVWAPPDVTARELVAEFRLSRGEAA